MTQEQPRGYVVLRYGRWLGPGWGNPGGGVETTAHLSKARIYPTAYDALRHAQKGPVYSIGAALDLEAQALRRYLVQLTEGA